MPDLVWDDKLAQVAANYAATCVYAHNAYRAANYSALGGSGTVGALKQALGARPFRARLSEGARRVSHFTPSPVSFFAPCHALPIG